jgi:putative hydrolase of the HAD superfamily
MQTSPEIHAVLFDYGQVLSGPPDPAAWARMMALTSLDEPAFHAAYWNPRHDYDRGTLTGRQYWRQIAGPNAPDTIIDQLIQADTDLWTQPNQPMLDWALALQRAGVRTGILSNIGDEMTLGINSRFDLSGFHHHTWSYMLNTAKPDPAIYTHAAAGLETPPPHILFIDDREDNIAAAQAVGMQTLRYTNHDAFLQEMHARGLNWLLQPELPQK